MQTQLSYGNAYCQYLERECSESKLAPARASLFFGYPSVPESTADAIRNAIDEIRKGGDVKVDVVDWRDLPVEGTVIFCEICKAIRKSHCAVLNITNANFNVLFECGFAIGAGRAIWPLVEDGISKSERMYAQINTLTTVGYSGFTNSKSVADRIRKKQPWQRVSRFELPPALGMASTTDVTGLLYLKSPQNNEPSLAISEILSRQPMDFVTDDPSEIFFHPMVWYLTRIQAAHGVLVHLGSERMQDATKHWAKCALVSGLALALGRRLLITGENVSFGPVDYRDLMMSYQNTGQLRKFVKDFVDAEGTATAESRSVQKYDIVKTPHKWTTVLEDIDLGEYIAEDEVQSLDSYFLPTDEFSRALQPGFRLFVGRKGSGKTANFYMILHELSKRKRSVVCQIKPKEYELDELVQFVNSELDSAKRGYLLESLWKFMVCSESLKTLYDKIVEQRPYGLARHEEDILAYVQEREELFSQSFASRLTQTVRDLIRSRSGGSKVPISELLHSTQIGQMQKMISAYIAKSVDRYAILVDNLDANWGDKTDYATVADILSALIHAAKDLWISWTAETRRAGSSAVISILIFLRNDVFRVVLEGEREPDKLACETICWRNPQSLLQVVERRIATRMDSPTTNWTELLEGGFTPQEMVSLLARNVLLRPRDVIYYFKRVFYFARLRKAHALSREDFKEAMAEYSEYALWALSAESQPYIPDMLDLLLRFADGKAEMNEDQVRVRLSGCGITSETAVQKTIDFLVESSFLGYGIGQINFVYPSSPHDADFAHRKALSHAKRSNTPVMFKIHRAFHEALSVR